MTPLLAMWPSDCPADLKDAVVAGMGEGRYGNFFRSVDLPSGNPKELKVLLSSSYREAIGPDASDTVLHVVMPVSLWLADAVRHVRAVVDAMNSSTNRFSLDIVGMQAALAEVVGEVPTDSMQDIQKDNIRSITEVCAGSRFHCCLCLVDNYIDTGASAKFNQELFGKFMTRFFKVMIDDYSTVFNPLMTVGGDRSVVSPGLSCLEFRRDRMTGYLLHRSFLAALDSTGINQEKVDSQGAATRAYSLLKGCDKFYSDFYTVYVEPLYESGLPEGEIAAQIKAPLDSSVAAFRSKLTSFMDDPGLSLPDKEATWAIILGRDNSRLAGTLYKQKELSFDDVFTEPTDLYIEAYNRLAAGSGKLPERGMYPELAYPEEEGAEPNPENLKAFDPVPQINKLKSELLDITAYLRTKERELEILKSKRENETLVRGHLSDEGFEFGGEIRKLEHGVVEQPLQEVYTPPQGLKARESVDLRKFFSPVRDQGAVGSCSSFSVIAVYESIMNRNNPTPEGAALSERFLFYHTNIATGRIDEGSNFYEQLEVFGKHGSCAEQLYPYTPDRLMDKPSEAAVSDAHNHRVLQARQIPLKSDGSKYDCITANHAILTAALSEGYPIAISLRICENFGRGAGGYVSRPSDEEISAKSRGNHAMVIVGYSERDKFYIVRNSWGEDFGDKGYCYISASYIDDPELNNFCCIITDTTDGPAIGGEGHKVPSLVASFGGTEAEIKMASISNAIDETRIRYASVHERYQQLYSYYSDLQERLSQPFVRNDIEEMAEDDSKARLAELGLRKAALIDALPATLKQYCRKYLKNCIKTALCSLAVILTCGLINFFGIFNSYTTGGWIGAVLTFITAIGMLIHYRWAKRKKRRELQEEIDGFAVAADRERRKLMEMQLHFHVGGLVLDAMHLLQLELDNDYNRLVSFNNNLKHWYEEDSQKIACLTPSTEAMFVDLTDPKLLDPFFEKHRNDIVAHISLLKAFDSYTLSTESMQELRDALSKDTSEAIAKLFDDFSMVDYLQQRRKYEYLPPVDLDATMKRLNRMANVLTRHNDQSRNYESRFSLINVPQDRMNSWRALCAPHFDFIPMPLSTSDEDILLILTVKKLESETLVL